MGASPKPERYSNRAIQMLRSHGHPVAAIGLREGRVADVAIKKHIDDLPASEQWHTLSLYLGPSRQEKLPEVVQKLDIQRVIFNPGTENTEMEQWLQENQIAFEVACTLVMLATEQYGH